MTSPRDEMIRLDLEDLTSADEKSDQLSLHKTIGSKTNRKGFIVAKRGGVKGNRTVGKVISQQLRKGIITTLENYDPFKLELMTDSETVAKPVKHKMKKRDPQKQKDAKAVASKPLLSGADEMSTDEANRDTRSVNFVFPDLRNEESRIKDQERDSVDDEFLFEADDSQPNREEASLSMNFNLSVEDVDEEKEGDATNQNQEFEDEETKDAEEEGAEGGGEAGEELRGDAAGEVGESGEEGREGGRGEEGEPAGGGEGGKRLSLNSTVPMKNTLSKKSAIRGSKEVDVLPSSPRPSGHRQVGWHPPEQDPLLHFVSKPPMKHLKDYVQAKGIKIAAWFLNVEAKAKFADMKAKSQSLPESESLRLDYWITVPQFLVAVASCPCNDHAVLQQIGVQWTHSLVESITKEVAALVEKKYDHFWNLNTPRGCFNYLGLFLIGESASFTDLPTEMTEEERRAELRKPEKDRIKVTQEELDLVQYKKWWNKQVEKARDRIEQLRYEDWLRHKPDSDLEFDWDLDEPFHPYQPPGGEDENLNLYLEACVRLDLPACSPFVRQIHSKECRNRYYGLGPKGTKAVAVALCSNEDIIQLDLTDNALGPMGAKYIAQAMKLNETVEELNLSENGIESFGLKMISSALLINSTITKIDLSGNRLRCCDAPYIAAVLRKNPQIVDLNLSHNQFADKGGVYLGQAIQRNKTLRKINLSWNHLKNPGSFFLLGGIRRNIRGLESVNLAFNGLSTPDMGMISTILKWHRTLKEFDISGNQLTPEHGVIIAASMKNNTRLEVLRLGQNTIGCASALAILQAVLKPESQVKVLDLEKVDVLKEFVDQLERSPRGQDLEVIRGHVMSTFSLTFVYQKKREFAREILTVFNAAHFRPVRVFFFKSKTDFIDFLLRFDKIATNEVYVPDMKSALENPIDFEFESEQLQQCQNDLEALAKQSTKLGFSSIRDTTFNFSGFYVV